MPAKKAAAVYTITNSTNGLDPMNQNTYSTEEEAIEAAKKILQTQPSSMIYVNQRLRTYIASVTVEEAPNEVPQEPVDETSPDDVSEA